MRALRFSWVVSSLYVLSFVYLVLIAGTWRATAADTVMCAFLVWLAAGVLMSAIEFASALKGTSPKGPGLPGPARRDAKLHISTDAGMASAPH